MSNITRTIKRNIVKREIGSNRISKKWEWLKIYASKEYAKYHGRRRRARA